MANYYRPLLPFNVSAVCLRDDKNVAQKMSKDAQIAKRDLGVPTEYGEFVIHFRDANLLYVLTTRTNSKTSFGGRKSPAIIIDRLFFADVA